MWVSGVSDVWDFVWRDRFTVVVSKRRYEVKLAEYIPNGWKGYVYVSSERECIFCFDTLSSLLNTLQAISEDSERGCKNG